MFRILFASLILGLFSSCGGGDNILFEMQVEAELIIPAGLNTFDTHVFTIRDVPTRIENYALTTFEDIDRIQASNATLIGRVQDIDYSIIDQIVIDVISESDPTDQKEIFYTNLISFNRNNDLQLLSSLSNVNGILTSDTVDLQVRIIFRSFPPTELDTRIIMSFNAYGVDE